MPFISTQTVNDVFDELADRLHEVSADEANSYRTGINLCTRDIAISFPNAPFNYVSADRTLSSGTRLYVNFPSDFDRLINVVDPTNDTKLKFLPEDQFNQIQPSASEQGNPTIYTLHGATDTANTQIEFYPVPGSSITVNYQYRKLPVTVSTASAALPIPNKYVELYNLFGEARGRRRNEEFQEASIIEAKYEQEKQKMISDFKRMTEESWSTKSIREFTKSNLRHSDDIVNLFWGVPR